MLHLWDGSKDLGTGTLEWALGQHLGPGKTLSYVRTSKMRQGHETIAHYRILRFLDDPKSEDDPVEPYPGPVKSDPGPVEPNSHLGQVTLRFVDEDDFRHNLRQLQRAYHFLSSPERSLSCPLQFNMVRHVPKGQMVVPSLKGDLSRHLAYLPEALARAMPKGSYMITEPRVRTEKQEVVWLAAGEHTDLLKGRPEDGPSKAPVQKARRSAKLAWVKELASKGLRGLTEKGRAVIFAGLQKQDLAHARALLMRETQERRMFRPEWRRDDAYNRVVVELMASDIVVNHEFLRKTFLNLIYSRLLGCLKRLIFRASPNASEKQIYGMVYHKLGSIPHVVQEEWLLYHFDRIYEIRLFGPRRKKIADNGAEPVAPDWREQHWRGQHWKWQPRIWQSRRGQGLKEQNRPVQRHPDPPQP